jgi:predicted nuclease of predicted toxin-antitoxin system
MRWLADENFPGDVLGNLRGLGWDAKAISEIASGAPDLDVLDITRREGRILLTFDKDFGELCTHWPLAAPSGVVLFRLPPSTAAEKIIRITTVLISRDDWPGNFSVVDRNGVRLRPMSP